MFGFLGVFAIILSILAVFRNRNVDKAYCRKDFTIAFLIVSVPVLAISALELLAAGNIVQIESQAFMTNFLFVYLAVIAYPFLARFCWRVNDAGLPKYWCFVGLIPYVNLVASLYLCWKPGPGTAVAQPA